MNKANVVVAVRNGAVSDNKELLMALPTFPEFDLQPRETVPTRFDKYQKRLNNLFAAMGVEEATRKKAASLRR